MAPSRLIRIKHRAGSGAAALSLTWTRGSYAGRDNDGFVTHDWSQCVAFAQDYVTQS
jgi:hypothetical protein